LDTQIKNRNKPVDLIIVIIAILLIPKLAIILTDIIYPFFQHFDPDESFLWITIHHVFQLIITIILMLALSRKINLYQWGFNLKNKNISLLWIGIFLIVFGLLEYFRIRNSLPRTFEYPLTAKNKLGIQFFQYGLSGLCEEPLFRGFVMVYLATNWNKIFKIGKLELPITILIATLLFMLAHLDIDIINLSVSGFDFGQQMKSLQLGILYGLAFHYTKSLLAPIVIHGLSNGLQFSIMYLLH